MILYIGVCNYIDVLVRAWLTFKQEPPCLRDLDHIHDEKFYVFMFYFFFHWHGSVIGCFIQSDVVVENTLLIQPHRRTAEQSNNIQRL